ncbi:MAG: hypothetical protein V3V97_20425 [Hyphomicrobiaceae bacterium]
MAITARTYALLGAVALPVAMTPLAASAHTTNSEAMHNGSRVTITKTHGRVVVRYKEPRPFLRRLGVHSGTLLFKGRLRDGIVSGNARTFRRNCPAAPYWVSGRMNTTQDEFILKGRAPIRSPFSCRVIGTTEFGKMARLRFRNLHPDTLDLHEDDPVGGGWRPTPLPYSRSLWRYRGSRLVMVANGNSRTIRYRRPAWRMRQAGVRRGDPFFRGRRIGNRIVGRAFVYRRNCAPIGYRVRGRVNPDNQTRVVLRGRVPIIAPGSCRVVGHSWRNTHARLELKFARQLAARY